MHAATATATTMSFKQQLCSPVAAIAETWNCVVDRDICLLKATHVVVASPATAWAIRLPNVLVDVVLW